MPLDPFTAKNTGTATGEQEGETGEPVILVRRSDEDVVPFDSQRIVDALVREASIDQELAYRISSEVRGFVQKIGFRALSSSLIRGLVDAKLLELGLEDAHRSHTRLGVPFYDVDRIMYNPVRDSALPCGPDGTSLILAEAIKREYSILRVFSEPVANAHLAGDIHIHRIGAIDRPHSITSSVDYVKRFGVALPEGYASSGPARHADVLMAHIAKLSGALQGYLAGPVIWDSLNFCAAPFLEGLDAKAVRQVAQALAFELSTPAASSGGQILSVDLHLDWDAPEYMEGRIALGFGGEPSGRTYGDYAAEARRFLEALMEVFIEGDVDGKTFLAPRLVLHLTRSLEPWALKLVTRLAAERGGVTVAFDRYPERAFGDRYGVAGEAPDGESHGWRSSQLQVVSLNLPRVGYLAAGRQVKVFEELTRLMEAAAQAHLEKRVFLEKLLALGERGPLAVLASRRAGVPFLRLNWTTHAIGVVGLDELCRAVIGAGLYDSVEANDFAVKVLKHIRTEAERLSDKHRVRFTLSSQSSESASSRLPQLDLRFFGDTAAEVARGDQKPAAAYYTDGVRLPGECRAPIESRIIAEGAFHSVGIRNAATEIWLGGSSLGPKGSGRLISRTLEHSDCAGLVFCPEFTVCFDCGSRAAGIGSACPACRSEQVEALVYAGERFDYVSKLPAGKRAELRDRYRPPLEEIE